MSCAHASTCLKLVKHLRQGLVLGVPYGAAQLRDHVADKHGWGRRRERVREAIGLLRPGDRHTRKLPDATGGSGAGVSRAQGLRPVERAAGVCPDSEGGQAHLGRCLPLVGGRRLRRRRRASHAGGRSKHGRVGESPCGGQRCNWRPDAPSPWTRRSCTARLLFSRPLLQPVGSRRARRQRPQRNAEEKGTAKVP